MKNYLIIITVLLAVFSCKTTRNIATITFNNGYKFSTAIEQKVKTDTVPWKYQFSAADYASKGAYQNALIHWDLVTGTRNKNYTQKQIDSISQKYHIVSAKNYIIEQSKKHQVIIINEAHHNSYHRAFTKSLLQELYDNGYRNLGLEALGNGIYLDSLLNKRKYPIQKTGHYIKDPQFGNLVRDALTIGYKLFAYENMGEGNGKPREIAQAKNIQKIIAEHPNEKFLIHCGYDHVLEGNHKSWEKAMTARLTEYTGINPFTINQTKFTERSKPIYNHPFLKALNLKESSVLLDSNNAPYQYKRGESWTDVAVFHPNTNYIDDRPNWLFQNGSKNVAIDLKEITIPFPVMVLAFNKDENINTAVPVDIYEVKDKNTQVHLALKNGKYNIVVVNMVNDTQKFDLKVK